MKLEVLYAANRRAAKKKAASANNSLVAYPLCKRYFGIVKNYKGAVYVIRMKYKRAAYPYHWTELSPVIINL